MMAARAESLTRSSTGSEGQASNASTKLANGAAGCDGDNTNT